MDYDDIFAAYYTQYRAEAQIPDNTDDEWTIGLQLANEALNRWANFDSTYWKDLYTTLQLDNGGSQTLVTAQTTYLAPQNFREAAGNIFVKDNAGLVVSQYPIIEPQDVQFKDSNRPYAWFGVGQTYYSTGTVSQSTTVITGVGTTFTADMVGMQVQYVTGEVATITAFTNATTMTVSPSQTVASGTYRIVNKGYSLYLNPAPTALYNGYNLDYSYYKKPSQYTTGTSRSEVPNSYFIVHHMLGNRFRASRNWSAYQSAKRDSEDALKIMQMDNNAGTWSNSWQLADNSGASFGG